MLTRGFVDLFRFVPFSVLYRLSDFVAWVLYRVVGYRRKVVMDNLRRCFPEWSDAERERVARMSYRNLADIMLESLKGTTAPLDEINRRYQYTNCEIINQVLQQGRSVILLGGHYNNWEWGVLTIAGGFSGYTIGVYKPLSNPMTDRWFFRTRSRDGKMILKSMKDTWRAVEEYSGKPTVYCLVADQSPSNVKTAIWTNFFQQDTACLPGGETIARERDMAVFMYEIDRIDRGRYTLTYKEVALDARSLPPGEVTQRFMSMMEAQIRRDPANWLWSHKRWKHGRN